MKEDAAGIHERSLLEKRKEHSETGDTKREAEAKVLGSCGDFTNTL